MQCWLILPLALALPALAILLRHWLFADPELSLWMGPSLWKEDSEELAVALGGAPVQDIDDEIRRRSARLAELESTGGSGTWTALAAMLSHARRIVELRQQRQHLIDESRRWRLPVNDPAGIHAPHRQDRSRRNVLRREDLPGG
jgi:hypothetical protein